MQKLKRRNTYTPMGIPHTHSNCDLSLNVEETLCVPGLKTFSNISDVALTAIRVCRTELASFYQCYSALFESETRQPIRYSATTHSVRRGTPWSVMKLPEGKTAKSCFHFIKCNKMFGCRAENTECDFSPRLIHTLKSVVSATPAPHGVL